MNRNDKVECLEDIGQIFDNKSISKAAGFTKGRVYTVLAGLGDGNICRTDGKVGGFLLNDNQMCLMDDFGNIRLVGFGARWRLKEAAEPSWPPRVPVTHLHKPAKRRNIPVSVMGEFSLSDASATSGH